MFYLTDVISLLKTERSRYVMYPYLISVYGMGIGKFVGIR